MTRDSSVSEYDAIAKTVQHYIDGAKSGLGADMKPAFHRDATIFGYVGVFHLHLKGIFKRRIGR